MIKEYKFRFTVIKEEEDGACIEMDVDGIKDSFGHGDDEVKLVHLGDVWCEDGNDEVFVNC